MSWLGLVDHSERRFSLRGIGHDRAPARRHPDTEDYILARGSIVFEARVVPEGRPHVLCGFSETWPRQRSLTFSAIPGGGISLVQVNGADVAHAAIHHASAGRTDRLRVTFAWDISRSFGLLSVERPEVRIVTSTVFDNPGPIRLSDLHAFIMGRGEHSIAPDMDFVALSDTVEPVGPFPSIAPEAMVETPWGHRPAIDLKRGDTVVTRGGTVVPVLHRVERTVPARGSFAPIRLRAPYFGLTEDVVVAPEQRLVMDGSEVEYLFNQEAVLVAASPLSTGFTAQPEDVGPTARYTQLILPNHEAVMVAGAAMESLYIGRLRRNTARLEATILRDVDRNLLPEHARPAHPELQWYEAIHLAQQRVA